MVIQFVETELGKERKSVIAGLQGKNHVMYWIDVVLVQAKTMVVKAACFPRLLTC